ncbi:MAG: nucleotide pyrophosphohydrolase [Aureliella sp.]
MFTQPPEPDSAASNDSTQTVAGLRDVVREFVAQRNWQQYHNAKNLTMALSVEAAELMEHFQWLTTDQAIAGEGFDREAVQEELSDVLCYAFALANSLDIDISQCIDSKMAKNRAKYPPSLTDAPASIEKNR